MLKRTLLASIAASALLMALTLASATFAQAPKTLLCHANGNGTFIPLELPPAPLDDHIDGNGSPVSGHEEDFFPVDGDCDKTNDPPTGPGGDPGAVPEPLTVLLLGAGVAGVGYASRRFRRNKESKTDSE